MSQSRPTRLLGILLALFGAALMVAGIRLLTMGDNAYFLVIGVGVLATGVLVGQGKRAGLPVYGVTLAVILVWSTVEIGLVVSELLPRIALPIILGLYLFSERVKRHLE